MDKPTRDRIEEARAALRRFEALPPDPLTDNSQKTLERSVNNMMGTGFLGQLRVLLAATATEEPASDPRPTDMAELAKLVAVELRKRGIWAFADDARLHISRRRPIGIRVPCAAWTIDHKEYSLFASEFDNLGPIGCADVIQAEEARSAREWAGDE